MRKRLTFIFFIASVTATVITLFQVYWVYNSYETAESNFHRMVGNTLEKSVVIYQLKQKQASEPIDLIILNKIFKRELLKADVDIPFKLTVFKKWGTISPQKIAVLVDFTVRPVVITVDLEKESNLLLMQDIGPAVVSLMLILLSAGSLFYMGRIIRRQLQLDSIKNDFINNIIHELRTPVSILKSSNEALTNFGASIDPERSARYLQINSTVLDKLEGDLERMLDIAQYEHGTKIAQYAPVNLQDLIKNVVQMHSLNNDVAIYIDYHLPPQHVNTDGHLIETILANLLDNAIKYADKQLIIKVAVSAVNEGWQLQVTDNGRGIDKSDLPFIFDKFYRVQTGDVHETKGYGLGLSYVKQLVNALNGHIAVASKMESGTTFTIKFPFWHG